MNQTAEQIHHFWFGTLDSNGLCREERNKLWFSTSSATDRQIEQSFGEQVNQAITGDLTNWENDDLSLIALILMLDQFTRNMYRGTPRAFAGDTRALALSQQNIANGHYRRLPAIHQVFLFMPLEHTEDLEAQEECVTLFEELASVTGSEQIGGFVRYAVAHRDVIARFGRFPHRNAILGRDSTPEEEEYLAVHGGF